MLRSTASLVLCAFAAGCASSSGLPGVEPGRDPCLIPSSSRDTLDIHLTALPSASHAPVPRDDAERLVFRQLYATLLRLDCTGAVRPALAERWTSDRGGRLWRLELGDYRFSDGTPITAQRVVESWAARGVVEGQPWIERVEAPGPRTIAVTFTDPDTAGLRLTGPALAVSGAATQGGWPETSGPFTIRSSSDTMIVAVPARSSRPVVRFRIASSDDGRDRLAAGAGLLITRDRETIAYGTRLGSMDVVPLAWDRMYALVSPTVPLLALPGDSAELARFRSSLALDAVRSEARGAEPPFSMAAWTCRSGFPSGGRPRPRVIYPQGDAVARGLAERIVALSPVRVTAAGLPPDALDQSLQGAEDAAFVLPFPRTGAACEAGPPIPAGASIEPLVDSRAHLIIRREAPPVTLDADGIPRVVP